MKNKQFEEWFLIQHYGVEMGVQNAYPVTKRNLYDKPFSMQWGVYLEFFDSVGIDLEARFWVAYRTSATRQEAQQMAIEKAFKILPT